MSHDPIIGRQREIAQLSSALREAIDGRGGLWLLTGEPGIGKSRLAEECERLAREAGFVRAWGRCWESGRAPAFWPWSQVVRALQRATATTAHGGRRQRLLASLLPEESGDPRDGAANRFELFDAVGAWLADISEGQPLWLCLEDLHAADPASLVLLEALVTPLRASRVILLGTVRDAAVADALQATYRRVARQAHTLALPRLDDQGARALLGAAIDAGDEALVKAAVEATGGLPLFLVELVRLAQEPGADLRQLIPASVHGALGHRLEGLATATHEVLAWSALIGMDIDRALLVEVFDAAVVDVALAEAVRVSLLRRLGVNGWRFSHALLCDVLADGLDAATRERVHATIANALIARGASDAARAHHLYAAGDARRSEAIDASLAAAEASLNRFAFEDAQAHLTTARAHLSTSAQPARDARIGVLEGLTLIGLGRVDEGLAACEAAADTARGAAAPEVVAMAALAYGSVFRFATVDPRLIRLLESALELLPEGDSALRAQLLARLAAARQPDPEPARPIALARSAIAMAERVGDVRVRAATLRAGCSALVDLAHPRERRELDQRHLDLALAEGLVNDELEARQRLAFDCMELGDLAAAERHIDRLLVLARQSSHPKHRWREHALAVLRDLWAGKLDLTRARIDDMRRVGDASGDGNVVACHAFQLSRYVELSGDERDADETADALGRSMAGSVSGQRLSDMARAHFLLQIGRIEEGLAAVDRAAVLAVFESGDRTMWLGEARWAAASEDAALGERLTETLTPASELFVADGVLGLCWRAPASLALAAAREACGDFEAALGWAEHAARAAMTAKSPPAAAESHALAARLASRLGRERAAAEHGERARELAERHRLGGIARRLKPPGPAPERKLSDVPRFEHEGDVWRIFFRGRTMRVKAVRGVAVLAHLVARPRIPIHVLDLAHLDRSHAPIDIGGAGEVIDPTARAAYRERIADLREQLDEAEDHNDLGRIDKLRAEIEVVGRELTRSTGLAGRQRRAPAAEEKARQAIRKQIRTALDRVRESDPELARYLERSIDTGRTCVFEP